MAYSADTFVADEQPTTAKWNKLWTNDASFNDGTGIATGAITSAKISGFDYSLATTNSNPYKFSVYRNAALNSGNSAYAKTTYDTELFDTNNNFDPVTNNRYTVPVTGFYQFNWVSSFSIAGASNDTVATLYKNGTVISWGNEVEGQGGSVGADILSLTAADYIEGFAYCSATTAYVATQFATRLSGYLAFRT